MTVPPRQCYPCAYPTAPLPYRLYETTTSTVTSTSTPTSTVKIETAIANETVKLSVPQMVANSSYVSAMSDQEHVGIYANSMLLMMCFFGKYNFIIYNIYYY